MDVSMLVGMGITILAIVVLSVLTGVKKQKSGLISTGAAAGLIMGTLVGGTSTIGTAQLAFQYGMSAWWFTLGGAIGCVFLAVPYVHALRKKNCQTLMGLITDEYGKTAGVAATCLNATGSFISVLCQVIAASAVLGILTDKLSGAAGILISVALMVLYVVFGGTKGAGIVGILKMILLYGTMATLGIVVVLKLGGMKELSHMFDSLSAETGRNLRSVFARGFGTDFGSCMSVILGVLCTQSYAQAVLRTKTEKEGILSALISALLIPIIGIFGIWVGLYMRKVADPQVLANNAAETAKLAKFALTSFILNYSGLPKFVAGLMLGALYITVIGAGAGISLGLVTIVNRDLIHGGKRQEDPLKAEREMKLLMIPVLLLAGVITIVVPNDTIQDFSFLSMGLRGCTAFAPLFVILFLSKVRVKRIYAVLSIILSSLVCLILGILNLFGVIHLTIASVFPGMAVGILCILLGIRRRETLQ